MSDFADPTEAGDIDHDQLASVNAGDHHTRYTDGEAVSAVNNDADHGSTASHNYYQPTVRASGSVSFSNTGIDWILDSESNPGEVLLADDDTSETVVINSFSSLVTVQMVSTSSGTVDYEVLTL